MRANIRLMIVVNVIALVAFVYGLSLAPPFELTPDRLDAETTVALTSLPVPEVEAAQ